MNIKKIICYILSMSLIFSLFSCVNRIEEDETIDDSTIVSPNVSYESEIKTNLPYIDSQKWLYNEEDDIYYQLGIKYEENRENTENDTLAIFVPGKYFYGQKNIEGEYFSCSKNDGVKVGRYTQRSAPIVLPINTPGYSMSKSLTEYSKDAKTYTDQGFVYVYIGARGRESGAPSGIVDFKAAIRYLKYNYAYIPGDVERIISFGMSGGGAQSALLGITGNSDLYEPYLKEVGAVEGVGDDIFAAMCWCPITNLESADMAYEWNMGDTRAEDTKNLEISKALSKAYGDYINNLKLKDENGNILTLEKDENGNFKKGTYYDYVKNVIEDSLNDFFKFTTFPYDSNTKSNALRFVNFLFASASDAIKEEDIASMSDAGRETYINGMNRVTEVANQMAIQLNATSGEEPIENRDNVRRMGGGNNVISGVFDTKEDYINELNKDIHFIDYDEEKERYVITSIEDFAKVCKKANKGLGAFDSLDRTQGENELFGIGDGESLHFDEYLYNLVGDEKKQEFKEDFSKLDKLNNDIATRLNMYSPFYYLNNKSKGYKTSNVSKYFRIRTGAWQTDTSLTTEINLYLALKNSGIDVDFNTIWGRYHEEAEQVGSSEDNFISWVNVIMDKG